MQLKQDKSFVHKAFWLSLVVKGIDGALQLVGGIAVLVVEPGTLGRLYRYLTRHLLGSTGDSPEIDFIREAAKQFSMRNESLVAIYLLFHGVIKVLLVYGLLKERLWVFPAAFVGFGLFLALEIYRLTQQFHIGIVVLMCVDCFVITMVWLEYKKVRAQTMLAE